MNIQVRLLGPVELRDPTGGGSTIPGAKVRGLLAVLALTPNTTVATHRLHEALWGEDEDPAANALHVTVSKLRRALTDAQVPANLVARAPGYALDVDPTCVDAIRFAQLVDSARANPERLEAVRDRLGDALALWAGDPLGGVPDTSLLAAERARLEELQHATVEDMIDARLALGEHERLVGELQGLVADQPLREHRWAQLMRALYGSNRQADALRAYERARQTLVEQIGVEPGAELRDVHGAVLEQDAAALGAPARPTTPVGGARKRRGNVRHPVASCVGRDEDLSAIHALVDQHRLVTLVGPGGVGKTRLALECCVARADTVLDGVWWVDLASARSRLDALTTIQRTLGLDASGDQDGALDDLCELLADREALLAFDNCEHLLAELVPAIAELLARAGRVRVLATSREALRIPGEAVIPVGPLEPDDATTLFLARLERPVDTATEPPEIVTAICDRLDCLPLAIELAAARARHLRLDQLLDGLDDRLALLSDGARIAPVQHRSLAAVAEWSYDLLEDQERVVFERLSIFADGATLDAARVVCAGPGVDHDDVERHLYRLVDKSLVVLDHHAFTPRFRMLQTLADFAADRLAAHRGTEATRRAHAEWVRDLTRTVGWFARTNGEIVAAVHDEDAAIRDALQWALVAEPAFALDICDALAPFWFGTMRASQGWDHLHAALAAAGTDGGASRASTLAWAVLFATMIGDIDFAERSEVEALAFERTVGDEQRLGRLAVMRAFAAGFRPDGDVAGPIAEARSHFATITLPVAFGHVEFADGSARLMVGDMDGAATRLSRAIEIFREEDDYLGLVLAVSRLGELAFRLGDVDLYATMHAELLELGIAGRTPGVVAGATARLAHARLLQGDVEAARAGARAAVAAASDSFMPVVNGYVFHAAGLVDLASGHTESGCESLHVAIDAFMRGAGTVGVGQAALCWIDLSRAHLDAGDAIAARAAAETAQRLAAEVADPWIEDRAARHAGGLSET